MRPSLALPNPALKKKMWVSPGRVSEHPKCSQGLPPWLSGVTTQGPGSAHGEQGHQGRPS